MNRPVTDAPTTVLYALSTFAQTCAALAAFVGAVGLFKLQLLSTEAGRTEHNIRGLLGGTVLSASEVSNRALAEIIDIAKANISETSKLQPTTRDRLREEVAVWGRYPMRHQRATRALFILEAWNLLVIGASLVGFNYVAGLAACLPLTWWLIWAASVGTVAATGYAVFAWTQG